MDEYEAENMQKYKQVSPGSQKMKEVWQISLLIYSQFLEMVFQKKYLFIIFIGLGIFMMASFSETFPERPRSGYWAMEGKLVTHHFEETTNSLSGPALFELQGEDGLPIWFGRYIFKDVCISGKCKMIRLWLFWDGCGNYLGMQIPENEPLTKSDHTEFRPEDYKKMDSILRDTVSILKSMKQESLIIVSDTINPYEVDGYSAATQPTLADVVVKDAVFTCHTLWHTVYGPVRNEIFRILENRLSHEFLSKMFESNKPEYISWAIERVENHSQYHAVFYPKILQCIKSDHSALANRALKYFQPELLSDTIIQQQLVSVIPDSDMSITYEILWKLIGFGQIQNKTVLHLLEMFSNGKIGVGAYNLILRLITTEHLNENEKIVHLLNQLSEEGQGYVRVLTKRTLDEKNERMIAP